MITQFIQFAQDPQVLRRFRNVSAVSEVMDLYVLHGCWQELRVLFDGTCFDRNNARPGFV